jgi:hypothetical protein
VRQKELYRAIAHTVHSDNSRENFRYSPIPSVDWWGSFNPLGIHGGTFVLFKGYIDESYDDGDFFVLSCTVSGGDVWGIFENEWQRCLSKKNAELRSQGRKELSRYHATDCQGKYREYKGWSELEQIGFTKELLNALKQVPLHSSAYTLILDDVREIFKAHFHRARTAKQLLEAAYRLTLPFCMHSIGETLAQLDPHARVTMFHDQSDNDGTILATFNSYQRDAKSEYGYTFSTIAALDSRVCLPLQAADFIAYEFYKDRKNEELKSGRSRRKSFSALLKQGCGVSLKTFDKKTLETIVSVNLGGVISI